MNTWWNSFTGAGQAETDRRLRAASKDAGETFPRELHDRMMRALEQEPPSAAVLPARRPLHGLVPLAAAALLLLAFLPSVWRDRQGAADRAEARALIARLTSGPAHAAELFGAPDTFAAVRLDGELAALRQDLAGAGAFLVSCLPTTP